MILNAHTATPIAFPLRLAKAGNGLRYIYDANNVAIARTLANGGVSDLAANAQTLIDRAKAGAA